MKSEESRQQMSERESADFSSLTEVEVEKFVDWVALQHISNGLYQGHVEQNALLQNESANAMLTAVESVESFLSYWKDCTSVISRRSDSGISLLFRVIPDASPIVANRLTYTISDCVITGLKRRPCFQIFSAKTEEPLITAHHSLLVQCQLVWAFFHIRNLTETAVAEAITGDIKPRLSAACAKWTSSPARAKTIRFFHKVFLNIPNVVRRDNNLNIPR